MLNIIREKFIKYTKAAGMEIILKQDDLYEIRLIILSIEKKKIIIEKKELDLTNLNKLSDYLNVDIPLSIVINGRGVLHKRVTDNTSDDNGLLQSILPNAKISDFYLQKLGSGHETLVSIVRREPIDKLLKELKSQNLYVVNASLGGLSAVNLLTLISSDKTDLYKIAEHTYYLDQQQNIQNYTYTQTELADSIQVNIQEEKIEEKLFISYAIAFNLLLRNEESSLSVESVKEEKSEFDNKILFKSASWVALISFLLILLVNYFLFMSFSKKHDEMVLRDNNYKNNNKELELLQKEVKEKEGFLTEAGWLGSSRISYYADRIAYTVPASVKLTELSVHPINEKESKIARKNLFNSGMIKLSGQSTRPTELNEWIEKIKNIEKVKQAKLLQYSYDNKDNIGSFSIEIDLQD